MLRGLALNLFTFVFVPLLFWKSKTLREPFQAHPACMCLAYAMLSFGIRAFTPAKRPKIAPPASPSKKGKDSGSSMSPGKVTNATQAATMKHTTLAPNHAQFQLIALSCSVIGAVGVQYTKWVNDYAHFKSWHSILGALASTIVFFVGVGGFMTYNYPSRVLPKGMKMADVWRNHGFGGALATSLMYGSLMMGLQSNWMLEHAQNFAEFRVDVPVLGPITGDVVYWYLGAVSASLIQLGNVVQVLLFS